MPIFPVSFLAELFPMHTECCCTTYAYPRGWKSSHGGLQYPWKRLRDAWDAAGLLVNHNGSD